MCADKVTLPVEGRAASVPEQTSPIKPAWQRWNDYGIACLLEGGLKRGHFKQAEFAFKQLVPLGGDATAQGHLNLARVYIDEGRFAEAAQALDAAGKCDPPAAPWSRAWFTAIVNNQNATRREHFDAVIADVEKLLDPATQPRDRGFDFTKDYVVWNTLANWLFKRRTSEEPGSEARRAFTVRAVRAAERVLELEAEDVAAHDLLALAYGELGAGAPEMPTPQSATAEELLAVADQLIAALKTGGPEHRVWAIGGGLAVLKSPKLPVIRELIVKLRTVFHTTPNPELKRDVAAVLAKLHRESHALYKPDEIARSNATRLYRAKNPAANYAAGDRVIYPTTAAHRDAILTTGELPAVK